MLLARGAVQDRPFGKTIGTIARRGVTAQLTAQSDGGTYAIAFDRGHIVAAKSPSLADSAAAVALAADVLSPTQVTTVERWLEAVPDADELQIIANVGLIRGDELHRLRRRLIAQRAARMVALEHGDFVLASEITLQVVPDCEMHVGGVVYQAARLYIYETQLRAIVATLGTRFELRPDAYDELPYYGFGDAEKPFLRALSAGVSVETIHNMPATGDRRVAMAMLYALASCGALYSEVRERFARGTAPQARPDHAPEQALATEPLTKSNAEEAFHRAQVALQGERLEDAVSDLELATQLAPNEPRYFAALAWARFCRAPDKTKVAAETRQMLGRAIARSDAPILPRYYLGMVERILQRPQQALEHFREVLELQPNHQEAATEIRFLTRRPR